MEVLNYKQFKVTEEMLASKSKRFANYMIDRILFYSLFLLLGIVSYMIAELIGNESFYIFLENLDSINPLLDKLITAIIFVIFYFILESISQITIGKLVTQTKVVLENGEKPAPETIILRSLCRFIPFNAISFLGNIPRGWHDTISKTFVVDLKVFEKQKKFHEDFHLIGK